jgi:iron complex outermembrane recepter protein
MNDSDCSLKQSSICIDFDQFKKSTGGLTMKSAISIVFAGSSLLAFASIATAQTASDKNASSTSVISLEEIVVTARRKDESLQDVPTTINAVTSEDLQKLSIRKFEDISSIVPGLSMVPGPSGIGAAATVRGVNYDVNASGNNGTVEFYLNDAPISANNLFQTVYDIQQIEVLRGPQGTLRGRASPSGSITVTTHRPDLTEMGGYVSGTGTNIGGYNGQGAFNFPIISNMLAVRVAAAYDKNEVNRVTSVNSSQDPSSKTKSGRATVRFEPTDSLSFVLTAQQTSNDTFSFDQVESQQVINPGAPVALGAPGGVTSVPFITASNRLAVEDTPRVITQDFSNYNFQAQWAFAGQKLNYVGVRNVFHITNVSDQTDYGNYFPSNYPAFLQGYAQTTDTHSYATAHELRLSSEERIGGFLDYLVGAFYQNFNGPTKVVRPTVVLFGLPSPTVAGLINKTNIFRGTSTREESVFGNLTAQVGDSTEVSGGVRYIKFHTVATLTINNVLNPAANQDDKSSATIYTAAVKHNFTDDLMVYASTGTSWRPGISATGDFSLARTPLENSFLILKPEKSTSYEIGLKVSGLEKRLRAAFSVYHQKFDDYPYRSASGVYYAETTALGPPPAERVNQFNFVAAVPVTVNGVEAQVDFAASRDWDMGASVSVSKGEIKSGYIPCNDYAPTDGVPDSGIPANVTAIRAATNGDNLAGCSVSLRASLSPQWSGSVQSEYRLPLTSTLSSFARGQMSIYGNSKNDPTNAVDDYKRYALLNLYLGVRDPEGAWEVALYGKNVTNTQRVLARSSAPSSTAYNIGATGTSGATNYYTGGVAAGLGMTAPREVGLSLRYAFGSK